MGSGGIIEPLPGSHRVAGAADNRRVLRGGAFLNNETNARCAVRNDNNPNNANRNNGLRVAVAHSSQEQWLAGNVVWLRLTLSIVAGWPTKFDAGRAEGLGFKADASFEDIIRAHVEDELRSY